METAVQKIPTTIYLRGDLIDVLNKEAKDKKVSLATLIEKTLMDVSFDQPNEDTKEAIEEIRAEKYAGTLDMTNLSMFIASIENNL